MDPGSRVERELMGGAQQTSDEPAVSTGRAQGKWENRQGKSVRFNLKFLCRLSLSSIRTDTASSCTGFRHLHIYFC